MNSTYCTFKRSFNSTFHKLQFSCHLTLNANHVLNQIHHIILTCSLVGWPLVIRWWFVSSHVPLWESLERQIEGTTDPGVFKQDYPVSGYVWRRISWYVAWLLDDSQIKPHFWRNVFGSHSLRATRLSRLPYLLKRLSRWDLLLNDSPTSPESRWRQ